MAPQQETPRVLSATSLKGYCRADPEGADDAFPTNSTIGPFDFFPGKYKVKAVENAFHALAIDALHWELPSPLGCGWACIHAFRAHG